MRTICLDGTWKMRKAGEGEWLDAVVPGSVYSNLLRLGLMEDPYYRENQYAACELSRDDYEFSREIVSDVPPGEKLLLRFDGLDTLAEVSLNGQPLGSAHNMHRVWEFDVSGVLHAGVNTLLVRFASPIRYIEQKQAKRPLWGPDQSLRGFPHLRKAHYMFGWDWAPPLPDMGIWRPVRLLSYGAARLDGVYVTQEHGADGVDLRVRIDTEFFTYKALCARVELVSPDGTVTSAETPVEAASETAPLHVSDPQLWWPRGYGQQPLYSVRVTLLDGETILDTRAMRVGLRTLRVSTDSDKWGKEFCFTCNGVKIFAMGGDYIPEDMILAHCHPDKTRRLLEQCCDANFNHVRVWGGGYYPDDCFYDLCDEMGLIVWQDFMFACGAYRMDADFTGNITEELIDNIKRIRHHACLGLWCGNNEMEEGWLHWGIEQDPQLLADYKTQFEELFPALCAEYDPMTFYWPSSPSCGGGFDEPNSPDRGDTHYWDVWHGMKPLTEFRKFYYRFCSEYGFESLPDYKTIRGFAEPEDLHLFSAVMEAHQKCDDGNKKLLYYISQALPYPYSFKGLIYCTQLMQADAIRSNVEHMRRHRGRCMGSTYWQINDSNPVISWSGIDYHHRWKALHYYARRFYAPVLLSVDDGDLSGVVFNISNERRQPVSGVLRWSLRDNRAMVLASGEAAVSAGALSASDCLTLDLSAHFPSEREKRSRYLAYELEEDGRIVSGGSSLFVMPKHFLFLRPDIQTEITETDGAFTLALTASAFAKSVCLSLSDADCRFGDNWFDIHGGETVTVAIPKDSLDIPADELKRQLTVMTCYDLLADSPDWPG